jgi:hypothetical protein
MAVFTSAAEPRWCPPSPRAETRTAACFPKGRVGMAEEGSGMWGSMPGRGKAGALRIAKWGGFDGANGCWGYLHWQGLAKSDGR